MKNFLSILSLTLAMGILFGCGSGESFDSEKTPSDSTEKNGSTTQTESPENSHESVITTESKPVLETELISERPDYPTVSGSFMQPWGFAGHSVNRFKEHMRYLKEVGIDTVILQWSFETVDGQVGRLYFQSDFDKKLKTATCDVSGAKLVNNLLEAAEEEGIKVFVGLNDASGWFDKGLTDRNWLDGHINLGVEGAKQLYNKYKAKYPNAFYGWYFSIELYNFRPEGKTEIDNAAYLLNGYRNPLHEIDPDMPFMLSPFINYYNSNVEEGGETWERILEKTTFYEGDIFCCQDSVGAGGTTIEELDEWFSVLKKAVDKADGLHFWANNEDFTGEWTTAPLDRFVKQMEITSKYVEGHVTFAYSHYRNPDLAHLPYHTAYKEYYNTGKVPETSLAISEVECTTEDGGITVVIKGNLDNSSATARYIYMKKDGALSEKIELASKYKRKSIDFKFTDKNIIGSGVAVYEIYAEDVYGNYTQPETFEMKYTGKSGTDIALGKSYELSKSPEAKYSDDNLDKLTNGKYGKAVYTHREWVGFYGTPEITIDLKEKYNGIYAFEVSTLGGGYAAVFAPNNIVVSVSNDGKRFRQVASKTFENDPSTGKSAVKKLIAVPESDSVSARYVKFTVSTNQGIIFIDEVTVLAE